MILRMLELVDYIHLASQDAHINDIKIPPVHLFCTVVSLMDHGGARASPSWVHPGHSHLQTIYDVVAPTWPELWLCFRNFIKNVEYIKMLSIS